jgi:hypothetical protein
VVNLLKNNREDPARLQPTSPEEPSVSHSNIRGAGYYN